MTSPRIIKDPEIAEIIGEMQWIKNRTERAIERLMALDDKKPAPTQDLCGND